MYLDKESFDLFACRFMGSDTMKKDVSKPVFWTEDETEQLISYWNDQGKSSGEIGLLLGKTSMSIIAKIHRLRKRGVELIKQTRWGVREKQPVNEDKKYRKCLLCQETFLSRHRFNKVCLSCALINKEVYEDSIMRVLK